MVGECEVIAVARLAGKLPPYGEGQAVELELLRVLKGPLKPGKHRVNYEDRPRLAQGAKEFVVFLGKGRLWRFVAQPLAPDGPVPGSVLRVSGFYDSNAYFVGPGLVTLGQLQGFLKSGALAYTFRGPLYFPQQGQAAWKVSDVTIEASYDAVKRQATVRGLPPLKGFPAAPSVTVGYPREKAGVVLTLSEDRDRPLTIQGEVQSLDPKDGALRAKFFVSSPDLLTRQAFASYLADPRKGHSYYTVRVACAPYGGQRQGRVLTLTLGREHGRIGEVTGWGKGPLSLDSMGGETQWSGQKTLRAWAKLGPGQWLTLRFDFDPVKEGPDVYSSSLWDDLPYRLLIGKARGGLAVRDANGKRQLTTFTASLGEVLFAKRDRPQPGR
jgi:hypothetical protein